MEDPTTPAAVPPRTWWQDLMTPSALAMIAGGLLLGAAIVGGNWWFNIKPKAEAAQKLYDATMDLWALYDLQMENKKAAGTYVNGLDALLATTKEGAALKARMAGCVDMNTVTVVGDAEKFKVELNVLDKERTLLKVKGPIAKYLWTGTVAAELPETSSSEEMGAPVAR